MVVGSNPGSEFLGQSLVYDCLGIIFMVWRNVITIWDLATLSMYDAADIFSSSICEHVTIRQYSLRTKVSQFSF